jgi:hypothetical protein
MLIRLVLFIAIFAPNISHAFSEKLVRDWTIFLNYDQSGKGLIDSKSFYIHPDGIISPIKELQATLENIKNPQVICRFPSRIYFLSQYLKVDLKILDQCTTFQDWKNKYINYSASLMFASFYENSPASIFGHIFIKLAPEDQKKLNLNDIVFEYSAKTEGDQSILYIAKGITGYYNGQLGESTLQSKYNIYKNLQNRDIWEYELSLTKTQKNIFLARTWELSFFSTPYYFFQNNCAHVVSYILQSTYIDTRFTSLTYPLPVEIIKAAEKNGYISNYTYYPSTSKKLEREISNLEPTIRKQIIWSIKNIHKITPDDIDRLPESALWYIYEYVNSIKWPQRSEYKHLQNISDIIRIKLYNSKIPPPNIEVSPDIYPHNIRNPATFSVGLFTGQTSGLRLYYQYAIFNDTDVRSGLEPGSSLIFFSPELRISQDHNYWRFDWLRVSSMRNSSYLGRSWRSNLRTVGDKTGTYSEFFYETGYSNKLTQNSKTYFLYGIALHSRSSILINPRISAGIFAYRNHDYISKFEIVATTFKGFEFISTSNIAISHNSEIVLQINATQSEQVVSINYQINN